MKNSLKLVYLNLFIFLFPLVVFAQANNVNQLVRIISRIVSSLIVLAVAVAILYFFWGLAQFIGNTGSGNEQDEAKQKMLWGIIALFVMVSVWGLVQLLNSTFVERGTAPQNINSVLPFVNEGSGDGGSAN